MSETTEERERAAFEDAFRGLANALVADSQPGGFISKVLRQGRGDWCLLDSVITEGMDDEDAHLELNRLVLGGRSVAGEAAYVCWTPDPLEEEYAFMYFFCDLRFNSGVASVNMAHFSAETADQ
jgi:hypothetical protein